MQLSNRAADPSTAATSSTEAGAGVSALTAAADAWYRARGTATQPQKVAAVLSTIGNAFIDSLPSPEQRLDDLETAHIELEIAWHERFRRDNIPAKPAQMVPSLVPAKGLDRQWISQAAGLANEWLTSRVPLTASGRAAYHRSQQQAFVRLVQEFPTARLSVFHDCWVWRSENGGAVAAEAMHRAMEGWTPMPHPPRPIAPYTEPIDAANAPLSGPGSVLSYLGSIRPVEVQVTTTRPGLRDNVVHRLPVPSVALPLVLDLDAWGGFRCDSTDAVESVVLHMMAALPAENLHIRLFDPERLGKSANYLYGLGEAAEKVIGDKVKTTPKELAELLVETEDHITFVTQKYLQGAFDSLTDYNIASEDVTEPYRLLLIHDFPSGFSRDRDHDREQFERLARIIATGRRCGVFVILVSASEQQSSSAGAANGLPWLGRSGVHPMIAAHGLRVDESVAARWSVIDDLPSRVEWEWSPPPLVDSAVASSLLAHVQRGLLGATNVEVRPERVAALARRVMEREVERGIRSRDVVVEPFEPRTWWHGTTLEGVTAVVGRLSAQGVADVRLDSKTASSVLIGGRPGSGKSVLLHSLILSLAQTYSPDELELFLVDFKEGVEFKQYATYGLPHAKVVAIESERDFGVSVLEALAQEIARRGQLFRDAGTGAETSLGEFRTRTGKQLPRVLLIIDEFQVLFDRDDKVGAHAADLLELVLRTGRAFGVHVVMASQTIAGMPALGRHLHNLIPTRIALQVSEADSRLLLGEDNPDARLLNRPGEGLLNIKGGLRDANQRFQATYWSPDERAGVLERLRDLAVGNGIRRKPVIFEGQRMASVADVDVNEFGVRDDKGLSIPLGTPMNLGGPVRVHLKREPGSNFLLVNETPSVLAVLLACLNDADVATTVLDYAGVDMEWSPLIEAAADFNATSVVHRREARETLLRLTEVVEERLRQNNYANATEVLIVGGLHRARDLDPNSEYEPDTESGLLKRLLVDGPEVGVHVVAWVDKRASLERRMTNEALREFTLRLVGPVSREDSLRLIDSDDAVGLRAGQAVFDDLDHGVRCRLRVFERPSRQWMTDIKSATGR